MKSILLLLVTIAFIAVGIFFNTNKVNAVISPVHQVSVLSTYEYKKQSTNTLNFVVIIVVCRRSPQLKNQLLFPQHDLHLPGHQPNIQPLVIVNFVKKENHVKNLKFYYNKNKTGVN
jgi:hypothetical protein